jgi:hypothetical protein
MTIPEIGRFQFHGAIVLNYIHFYQEPKILKRLLERLKRGEVGVMARLPLIPDPLVVIRVKNRWFILWIGLLMLVKD